jgi:hypothetical protein
VKAELTSIGPLPPYPLGICRSMALAVFGRGPPDTVTTMVMFLLVPQVKLPKRLDVARAAEH